MSVTFAEPSIEILPDASLPKVMTNGFESLLAVAELPFKFPTIVPTKLFAVITLAENDPCESRTTMVFATDNEVFEFIKSV